MEQAQTQKLSNIFEERVRSLLDDHYCRRVFVKLPHVWIARLHHMSNGNDIVIKVDPNKHRITQWTNKVKTHDEYLNL